MFRQTIKRDGDSEGLLWGIRHKVLGLVVFAAVLPTAVVGSMSYWTARNTLTEKLSDQLNTQASLTAATVSEWFQERERDAQIFAESGIVSSNLEDGRGSVAPRDKLIVSYLEEVIERYGLYRTLAVVDESGQLVGAAGKKAANDIARIPNFEVDRGAELEWTEEGALLWLFRPVFADGGRAPSRLVLVCDVENLRKAISARDGFERVRLSASSGRLVLAEPDVRGQLLDFPNRTFVDGGLVQIYDARGIAVLATSRTIDGRGLREPLDLIVAIDRDVAFAPVNELRGKVLLLSALAVLLVGALGYVLVASLVNPLEQLAAGARAVAQGNFETRVPAHARDEIGYLIEVFNQMTAALKVNHERLQRLSTTDELTQLSNRRELENALAEEVAQAASTGNPMSIIMIDIDHFKSFNDRFGHLGGDDLLRRLGKYLLTSIPENARAARYGGEEFLVILPDTSIAEAKKKAEALRVGFSNEEGSQDVTLSMGVASWEQEGVSATELIDAADRAVYQAKDLGRNRTVTASMAKAAKPKAKRTRLAKSKVKRNQSQESNAKSKKPTKSKAKSKTQRRS